MTDFTKSEKAFASMGYLFLNYIFGKENYPETVVKELRWIAEDLADKNTDLMLMDQMQKTLENGDYINLKNPDKSFATAAVVLSETFGLDDDDNEEAVSTLKELASSYIPITKTGSKEMLKHEFETKCYEAYKLQWMLEHHVTISELMQSCNEIENHILEYEWTDMRSIKKLKELPRRAQERFETDLGFDNGCMWKNKDEFLKCEFTDEKYMRRLFTMMHATPETLEFYTKYFQCREIHADFIPFELALEVRGKYRITVFATDRNSALAKADGNCACAYFGELEDYTWDDPIV